MIRQLLRFSFLVTLAGLFMESPAQGSEQQLVELVRRAERIVIGAPSESVNLRGAGLVSVRIERVLRGRGRKGEPVSLRHDGGEGTVRLEAGRHYLLFLRQARAEDEWLFVGKSALPFHNAAVQTLDAGGRPDGEPLALGIVQGLIDKYPTEADFLVPVRHSFGGRWTMVLTTLQRSDVPLWIVNFVKRGDRYEVKMLSAIDQFNISHVELTDVGKDSIRFSVTARDGGDQSEHVFDFQGRLHNGIVRGNVMIDHENIMMAQLHATNAVKMSHAESAKVTAGRNVLAKAAEAEDTFAAYEQFLKDYPNSPLALSVYVMMLKSETASHWDAKGMRALTSRFFALAESWGSRSRDQATVNAAVALTLLRKHPELALELLEEAESRIGKDGVASWKDTIAFHKAVTLIALDKPKQALDLMRGLYQKNSFDPQLAYRFARFLEMQGKMDEAIEVYARLTSLPGMNDLLEQILQDERDYSPPGDRLASLWRRKYGRAGGMEKFITEAYRRAVHSFATKKFAPRGDAPGTGNRVALVELFTGAQCPPCVAADLGTGGLEDVFEHSEVIVIRYHVHSPGPDPLAGPDSEARMVYYNAPGTPTVVINGQGRPPAGGHVIHARQVYSRLRRQIEPILKETVDVKIQISAQVKEGKIVISALASRPEGFRGDMRLRLALVEEEIPFVASNGILLHEMVVRTMPGGAKGIAPSGGKIEFRDEIALEEFRALLEESLTGFEKMYRDRSGVAFKFPIKPIGPEKLYLVAFVQDDAEKVVLQSAIVPVEGELKSAKEKE